MARATETTLRVATFATQGAGSHDAARSQRLVADVAADVWPFVRARKLRSAIDIFRRAVRGNHDLVVMEGTGVAGGLPLIVARLIGRAKYVVSTGDAVAPYIATVAWPARPVAAVYERFLYRLAAGVIGWSPYITGRALTLGAQRAMTAPHWSLAPRNGDGERVRQRLGISPESIVVGVVGSLSWNRRRKYCYGLELISALEEAARPGVVALIVGDGSGKARLVKRAGDALDNRVFLPGSVPPEELHDYLAAMDVALLAQSVDGVGAYRYTSKLSDYLGAGIPVVSTQIPAAYDIGADWMWRLEGDAPWDSAHIRALASFLQTVDHDEIQRHRELVPSDSFDADAQQRAVTAFLTDLVRRSR